MEQDTYSNRPLVSVLVTLYNREEYLAECLDSILASTYQHFEVVIVDDQSTDGSLAIAEQYAAADSRIQVHQNEVNIGDYPNRNQAAEFATGQYLKYVDSDDSITAECLEEMVDILEARPDAAFVLSYPRPEGQPRPLYLSPEEAYRGHLIDSEGFFSAGPLVGMIRTDDFRGVGGFRPSARHMGDTLLWLELSRTHSMAIAEDGLAIWRVHDGQEHKKWNKSGLKNSRIHSTLSHVVARDFLNTNSPLPKQERRQARRKVHIDNFRRVLWHLKNFRFSNAGLELLWSVRTLFGLYSRVIPANQ